MPAEETVVAYGWANNWINQLTQAVMVRLGVAQSVTCSNGSEHRPRELWSATDKGLAHLILLGEYEGVEVTMTPWAQVRDVEIVATSTDALPDPVAKVRIPSVGLELEVDPSSSMGGSRAQQWPFVQAVLSYVSGRSPKAD
jgi:hypothetical protein